MVKKKTEDITIDFSFVKNLFSGPKKKKPSKQDDISMDFSVLLTFLKKYAWIFLILIPIILSIQIRTSPSELIIAENWARQGIYNNLRNNIASQIAQQYPHLPDQNKQALLDEQLNLAISQQEAQIEEAVKIQAEIFRERFRDDEGTTYLGDIDSYFWARYAQNIVDHGYMGDEKQGNVQIDTHMKAPLGYEIAPNLYPYVEAYLFKFLRLFNPKVDILEAAFLTPLFLSFFAIIAAFFIGKKLSGNLAGFLGAMLIAVNPTVLSRSLGSDNDIVNVVFPLIIMLFTILAFDSKNYKKTAIYAAIMGLLSGMYSFAWSGWWFMFLFIIGAGLTYVGYLGLYELINKGNTFKNLLKNNKLKLSLLLIGIFTIFTFIGLSMFGHQTKFFMTFANPLKIINLKEAAKGISLWPNVYTTVAELNSANLSQIINSLGGKTFLWLALIGTLLSLVNFKLDKKLQRTNLLFFAGSAIYFAIIIGILQSQALSLFTLALLAIPLLVGLVLSAVFHYKIEPSHSILTTIWFIATIYAATRGIRFILLIIPAFVISFSALIGSLVEWATKYVSKTVELKEIYPKILFICLALLILKQPIDAGRATALQYIPSVNDAWVESLTKIKLESEPDAIINSWWDFGHWFKYWGDRAVTFDGASQNDKQAHWIGKVLLTDDEELAVSILRMLDCGSNRAEEELQKITGDTYDSVKLIYKYLGMTESQVKKDLLKLTTEEKTDEILSYLFCEPPENYFITSGDMVGKSGVWAHFGIWNFERAKIYNYFTTLTVDEFSDALVSELGYSKEDAIRTYYDIASLITDRQVNDWIAPWPSYGGVVGCSQNNETTECNIPTQNNQYIPLQIDLRSHEASINANNQKFYPNNLGYFKGLDFEITTYTNNTIGYGVVMLDDSRIAYMSDQLTGSMFTRLYYLDGKGLKYFTKFHDVTGVDGSRIITWKIEWPK